MLEYGKKIHTAILLCAGNAVVIGSNPISPAYRGVAQLARARKIVSCKIKVHTAI